MRLLIIVFYIRGDIGKKLSAELAGKPVVMYASDLARAKQTAEIVGKHLGLQPILETALRERNLGKCVGKSIQWLKEHIECQEKTIDDRMFSDAESRRDVWNRLSPFFEKMMASEAETVIIVSHGDLLSVFNAMFLGAGVTSLNHFELYGVSGGVSKMYAEESGKRIIKKMSDHFRIRI